MTREYHALGGTRVVALGGDHLASVRDWVTEVDFAVPKEERGHVAALLMDFRAQSFAPSAEEAGALLESLRARFGGGIPLATVAKEGSQFGGTRVLCTLAELSGCRASAFLTKAEAWLWLRAQLDGSERHAPRS
jgi:hypothetical protein